MTTDLSVKASALPVWDVADLQPVLETAFGSGGTFRDLLVALSSKGPCLISGAALREALDACQIRQALDEFLPYPQVVESLDEVYVTRSGDRSEIALHFAQPHALPQSTPFGTVTIHIGQTLTLTVDERGDATLKPGDMRVRWLGVSENLLVRLRRIEGPQGAQDVVQVSAGNILSQTTPLSVLTLRAAPIREVVAPAVRLPLRRQQWSSQWFTACQGVYVCALPVCIATRRRKSVSSGASCVNPAFARSRRMS